MKSLFKAMKWNMILFGAITTAIGAVLVAYPDAAAKTMCLVIGWVLILTGAFSIGVYFRDKKYDIQSPLSLVVGVIELGCGIFIAFHSETFVGFLSIIFAILLLVHSINDIAQAINIKKMGFTSWKGSALVGVIGLILAGVIFYNPFSTMAALMILVGIALIMDGFTDILIALRVGRCAKEYAKAQEFQERVENSVDVDDFTEVKDADFTEVKDDDNK